MRQALRDTRGKRRHNMAGESIVQPMLSALESDIVEGRLPPFVCTYPPRSAYVSGEAPADISDLWRQDRRISGDDINIYVHVPFCSYKCGFCNLYTVICTNNVQHDRYVRALRAQIRLHREIIESRRVRTLYIGGGTPTLLPALMLGEIFAELDIANSDWRHTVEEVAIEASPDSLSGTSGEQYVRDLAALGINRVNVGVQSLQPRELKDAGRARAGTDQISQALHAVRLAGIRNLSTDLIIGFSGQKEEDWDSSVNSLLEYRPDTISTYFLTIRPDAWFSRTGRYGAERDQALWGRYDRARSRFLKMGYVQDSNVRFKLPGTGGYVQKSLQFSGVPVLGIGAGSRSYNNTNDYLIGGGANPSVKQVEDYMTAVESGSLAATSGFRFDPEERLRKRFALGLMDLKLTELDPQDRASHLQGLEPILEAARRLGLVEFPGPEHVRLTPLGLRHKDVLSWAFFSDLVRKRDAAFFAGLAGSARRPVSVVDPRG